MNLDPSWGISLVKKFNEKIQIVISLFMSSKCRSKEILCIFWKHVWHIILYISSKNTGWFILRDQKICNYLYLGVSYWTVLVWTWITKVVGNTSSFPSDTILNMILNLVILNSGSECQKKLKVSRNEELAQMLEWNSV